MKKSRVSIPSRGFWFFEASPICRSAVCANSFAFQSPRGDFGFLKSPVSAKVKTIHSSSFNPLAGILVF